MPLRVVVVHDSPTIRASLRRALVTIDLEIVGEGNDGAEAAELVVRMKPDVVLMDIVMPRMDGYAATRAVMAIRPTPIVLISSVVATRDVSVAMQALRSGALAVAEALPPPSDASFESRRAGLVQLLRAMSNVDVGPRATGTRRPAPRLPNAPSIEAIGIAASTGGPQVIDAVLRDLPPGRSPPILIVQHIARGFTEGFAQWLASSTGHRVEVARHGELAARATVYVAPEDQHLGLDASLRLVVDSSKPVGGFRPSGTYLFASLSRALGARAAGILLSGMGKDGASGLLELRGAGGDTLAQDEATSVIFGMPRAAIDLGAAKEVLGTREIGPWIEERSRS